MPSSSVAFAAGAAAAAIGYYVYQLVKNKKVGPSHQTMEPCPCVHRIYDLTGSLHVQSLVIQPTSIKVTYFDMQATPGEKLRLACVLTVGKEGFTDDRVPFKEWPAIKEARKPKYGQMPIVTLDGQEFCQSGAMLRYLGGLGDGSLYPTGDKAACLKIEEMLGLADDFQRAWTPGLYSGMNPKYLGLPADMTPEAKAAKVKELREAFLANELPKYMTFISNELKQTGAFIAGPTMTIADCQLYPQLAYFERGVADYVPKTCLEAYPEVVAYLQRVKAVPAIKDWYKL